MLTVSFPDVGDDSNPFTGCLVHRVLISASLGALFEVTLTIHSTDPHVAPHTVIGLRADLTLEGEPYVERISGVVRAMRQLTSQAGEASASYYEVVIAPPHFMTRHRAGRRIHQNRTGTEIVSDTLAAYGGSIPAPTSNLSRTHEAREYCVQYDESDHDFLYRVLAEEHLVSYFDPAQACGMTILDDVATLTPILPFRLPFKPPSNLEEAGPAALALRFADEYATGVVNLRDYDHGHPLMSRSVPVTLDGDSRVPGAEGPFAREELASHEGYGVGRFNDERSGDEIARRHLTGIRASSRTIECETNLAIFPGTRFYVDDHPRADAAGELLVVASYITIDRGIQLPTAGVWGGGGGVGTPRRHYGLECVRVAQGFVPEARRKPRAIGPETAFVVGALADGQVDVDEYGRVLVEFVSDRRDKRKGATSRRVRVSQGWAGPSRGFVTLPRIGDEVWIGYDGGDPDQPMVVGSAHNAVARTPNHLPDPDKTVSVWRSRTVGGDGYNQVLMDDQAARERLEIRAEKSRTDLTLGDESSTVGGSFTEDVGGRARLHVHGPTTVKLDDSLDVTAGDTTINVKKLDVNVDKSAHENANGKWTISASSIELSVPGASITLEAGTIKLKAMIIQVNGSAIVDVQAALIKLN